MKTFENKTVLITGGTSGIGKAAALAFAKEGANVVVSGRRVAEGEEVSRGITSAGGSALFVRADVSREDDIVALVEKTAAPVVTSRCTRNRLPKLAARSWRCFQVHRPSVRSDKCKHRVSLHWSPQA